MVQATAAVLDEAYSAAATARGRRAAVFSAGRKGQDSALQVANAAALGWIEEIRERRLGAEAFARNMTGLARRFGLEIGVDGYRAMAECFGREGLLDRALAFYRKARAADRGHPHAMNDYGVALGRARQYRKSVRVLREAHQLRPRDPMIARNLGLSLAGIGRFDEATAMAETAICLASAEAAGWQVRALVHFRAGRWGLSLEDAEKAAELDPTLRHAWVMKALCLGALGRPAQGLAALDRAHDKGEPTGSDLLLRARLALDAGRVTEAGAALRRLGASPDAEAVRADFDTSRLETEVRVALADATRLAPLADSVQIDLPPDVNFADWKQLSAHLHSQGA